MVHLRAAAEQDLDGVLALALAEEAAWFGGAESSAEEVREWVDDEGGIALGAVAADPGGRIRGFASPGRYQMMFVADPTAASAVADVLLPWLLERSRGRRLVTFAADAERAKALQRHGLRPVRSSYTLARPASAGPVPAAAFPDGVEAARYRLGDDDAAVHRLIYVDAAFGSVRGHEERGLDDWRQSERPCRTMFLARRGGRLVGYVSGRVLDSGRGEIQMLAVAARERGRGIGRGLLLQAFADLQRAGSIDLSLWVEGDNEAALRLYRSVGLEVEREWRAYVAP